MRFLKRLFYRGAAPVSEYVDPIVGPLKWSEEKEAWIGAFGSLHFWIAYEYAAKPRQETLAYAASRLADSVWQRDLLREAKSRALDKFGVDYKEEIDDLAFVTFSFHGENHLSIYFFDADDQPWWVAEIEGCKLLGVSRDS